MNRQIYTTRMSYSRYDDTHCLAYLNEEVVENYVPDDAPEDFEPVTGYAYSGPEDDGGTMIDAANDSRDSLINGIIRSRYSQTEEDAIKTHQIMLLKDPECDKASEYASEWAAFCAERGNAIRIVDGWLS
ncbi:MAG: hypothetical protein IJE15_09985 [Bacteroidaceae bacterium]|nr:hypothetical protein [Bacteroidaceae bacterium]